MGHTTKQRTEDDNKVIVFCLLGAVWIMYDQEGAFKMNWTAVDKQVASDLHIRLEHVIKVRHYFQANGTILIETPKQRG